MLFVVRRCSLMFAVCRSLLVVCCVLFGVRRLMFAARCSLFAVRCLLFIRYLLFVVCGWLCVGVDCFLLLAVC